MGARRLMGGRMSTIDQAASTFFQPLSNTLKHCKNTDNSRLNLKPTYSCHPLITSRVQAASQEQSLTAAAKEMELPVAYRHYRIIR